MHLGIWQSSKPAQPPRWANVDRQMWLVADWHARFTYEGPTEEEPSVAQLLLELRTELMTMHHLNEPLNDAHGARDQTVLAFRSATREEEQVATEAQPCISAGHAARRRTDDPYASHERSEGARAAGRLKRARELLERLLGSAEGQNLRVQQAAGQVLDRMEIAATAGLARINRYLTLLNARRAYYGAETLAPLPMEWVERLVLDACRRLTPAD